MSTMSASIFSKKEAKLSENYFISSDRHISRSSLIRKMKKQRKLLQVSDEKVDIIYARHLIIFIANQMKRYNL